MLLIENKNPLETHTNFGPYTHRLELKDDDTGEILGVAELVYINDGIPLYYLFYICIKQ